MPRVRGPREMIRRLRAWRNPPSPPSYPFQATLSALDEAGVTFEISNPVEYSRVRDYAGEQAYLSAMLSYLNEDDVLFDIGANVGLVSLHAARRCRVVAFEPDPSFRGRLELNLSLNPDIRIDVLPIAISDGDGSVTLYTDGAEGMSPSLRHQRDEKDEVTVQAQSLDSLVAENRLPAPTVLKIDIEGAEALALRGATSLLTSDDAPRALFLEIHPQLLGAFGASADDVMQFVESAGYTQRVYEAKRTTETHLILCRP
jgi:FkbM family methyltransferase